MISAERLMSYLPWYYQESRVMRSIMEAVSPEIPDAIGHLWKAFFLHLAKDDEELLRYYREELQAYELAALFAKLRSGGILNKELLASQGIEAVDTHIYSPEGGYVLSGEEAVFPDGVYYAPLIVDLRAGLELINIARKIVGEAEVAGARYWFSLLIHEKIQLPASDADFCRVVFPGVLLPLRYREPVSGESRITTVETTAEMHSTAKLDASIAREETEFWLDLPMLVSCAVKQGLIVVPDAVTMLAPSHYGELSRDGVLASGQKEDITVCLVSGDLAVWLSMPVRYTRRTWQMELEEVVSVGPKSSSVDYGREIECNEAGGLFASGNNAYLSGRTVNSALVETLDIAIGANLVRPAWWSPAVTFLEESVTFLNSTLTAQAATIEQQP